MSSTNASENTKEMESYLYYIVLPLKLVGCWDIFPNTNSESRNIINDIYLALVLFVLLYLPMTLIVYLYTEWEDIMSSLDKMADSLPLIVSLTIVAYYAMHRHELYELVEYMDKHFKYHSAQGLTNMTMFESCKNAKKFARVYTACCMFSVNMYTIAPVVIHLFTDAKVPLQGWMFMDMTRSPLVVLMFLVSYVAQLYIGLAMGQFGVFFAANSILICGQLDLVCCSLRNTRYTALLKHGIKHSALVAAHADIQNDEKHNYIYNVAEMKESTYHYDQKATCDNVGVKTQWGKYSYDTEEQMTEQRSNHYCVAPPFVYNYIYSSEYDNATMTALRDCASLCQVVHKYKEMFEKFVSPLLVVRVVQVTLYLCTLLYTATLKLEMTTVEYLVAVALDIFVYCYYGNQIILQADRVSTAAYQSAWHTMGVRPRRMLLNILLANKKPTVVRAGRFLPMDLHTFVVIIKTSFSYYTLLVNVNEK